MNDFEKAMFIFFNEWGGSPYFQAEHDALYFFGVDIDELIEANEASLFNELFDLGWMLTLEGDGFMSFRWGSC